MEHVGKALAVILKHHGVIAYGKNLDKALSAAIYLEESCGIYLKVLATNREIPILTQEQIDAEDVWRILWAVLKSVIFNWQLK